MPFSVTSLLPVYRNRYLPRIAENFRQINFAVIVGGGGDNDFRAFCVFGYLAVKIFGKGFRFGYKFIVCAIEVQRISYRRVVRDFDFQSVRRKGVARCYGGVAVRLFAVLAERADYVLFRADFRYRRLPVQLHEQRYRSSDKSDDEQKHDNPFRHIRRFMFA